MLWEAACAKAYGHCAIMHALLRAHVYVRQAHCAWHPCISGLQAQERRAHRATPRAAAHCFNMLCHLLILSTCAEKLARTQGHPAARRAPDKKDNVTYDVRVIFRTLVSALSGPWQRKPLMTSAHVSCAMRRSGGGRIDALQNRWHYHAYPISLTNASREPTGRSLAAVPD